jgi:murein DD-endopeptidase MepM/ murein hydrolase activator NlpD
MHTRHRVIAIVAIAASVLAGASALKLAADVTPADTKTQLDSAMAVAGDAFRERSTLEAQVQQAQTLLTDARQRLVIVGRQKRLARFELSDAMHDVAATARSADEMLQSRMQSARAVDRHKRAVAELLRIEWLRPTPDTTELGTWLLRRLFVQSLGKDSAQKRRTDVLLAVRKQVLERLALSSVVDAQARLTLHAAAAQRTGDVAVLRKKLTALQDDYRRALHDVDGATATMENNARQIARIQEIEAEVQQDIVSMQGELARIDGRLRAKVERELIQKGLLEDGPDRFRRSGTLTKGDFSMPVDGNITAGYYDAHYKQFFGVAHKGVDIAVPQGTQVGASTEGYVYVVRNGGPTGYTYVLIAHRDGYATLYGHLSKVLVAPGQHVDREQTIGLSGGTPGTHGAGPMTTGAHLHFEVLHNGEHIDPRTVLP